MDENTYFHSGLVSNRYIFLCGTTFPSSKKKKKRKFPIQTILCCWGREEKNGNKLKTEVEDW